MMTDRTRTLTRIEDITFIIMGTGVAGLCARCLAYCWSIA